VKYAFVASRQVAFPVAVLCRVLDVSRSGFYEYLAEPVTERQLARVPRAPRAR
jgi:hypothetical protein